MKKKFEASLNINFADSISFKRDGVEEKKVEKKKDNFSSKKI